jgi:hypothetical protein
MAKRKRSEPIGLHWVPLRKYAKTQNNEREFWVKMERNSAKLQPTSSTKSAERILYDQPINKQALKDISFK